MERKHKTRIPGKQISENSKQQNIISDTADPEIANFGAVDMLDMQRQYGNTAVQRMLKQGQLQHVKNQQATIQRWDWPWGGGEPEQPQQPANPKLDNFINQSYSEDDERFFMTYNPTGGQALDARPVVGAAVAELRLHVTFDPFDTIKDEDPYKDMTWTPAQEAEFAWQPAEETAFKTNLQTSIQDGWSEKHTLSANEVGLEEVSTKLNVVVKIEPDEAKAHVKLKAIKTPVGAPRYRSSAGMDEATFDWRDPTEDEDMRQTMEFYNIGPFENNSDDVTTLTPEIDKVITAMGKYGVGGNTVELTITGRSTTPGSKAHNEDMALRRASNVNEYISNNIPATLNYDAMVVAKGEEGTTTDDEFRRVDVEIVKTGDFNTAAHEAGHMFGLDDEYEDEGWDTDGHGKGRFNGDKPDHYKDVENELGKDAADKIVTKTSDSIMAGGKVVEAGHYVPFIQALEKATNIQWTIK